MPMPGTVETIEHDDDWYTIFVELGRLFSETLASRGELTLTQFRTLLELKAIGGSVYAKDLAARLVLDPSSVSNAIEYLAGEGCVSRGEDSGDRRLITLAITDCGEEALSRAAEALWESISIAWEDLTPEDVDVIYQNTKDVVARLKGYTYIDVKDPIKPCYFTTIVLMAQLLGDRMNRRHRLSLTESRILLHLLSVDGAVSCGEVCSALLLGSSTVSRSLSKLTELGLVCSPRDTADRRRRAAGLTEQGRTLAETLARELSELSRSLYVDVPDVMNADVNRITKTICATLRRRRTKGS